jgi:hypothetical protein
MLQPEADPSEALWRIRGKDGRVLFRKVELAFREKLRMTAGASYFDEGNLNNGGRA